MNFDYVIKSADRASIVNVTIAVDESAVKPRLIFRGWLDQHRGMIGRMIDSEQNRAHLQEYSEAVVARRLADAILDRAVRAQVLARHFHGNRYATTCRATGRRIPEGSGFEGVDWFSGKRAYYSWAAIVARFSEV